MAKKKKKVTTGQCFWTDTEKAIKDSEGICVKYGVAIEEYEKI